MISVYDELCRQEFSELQQRVDRQFMDIDIGCPYGLPEVATFHQATFAPLGDRFMELFLAAGYRRNGNSLYCMRCRNCSACVPIRLHPVEFVANRNQRRTLARNQDLDVTILPLTMSGEEVELCDRFLQQRYPRENNSAHGYYRDFFLNQIVSSAQMQFRLDGRLLGVSIIDVGRNWLNAVYFYFDPSENKRSLGTFNILQLIDRCLRWRIDYLYLGYHIAEVSAMSYKANYYPHHLLQRGRWRPVVRTP